MLNYTPLQCIYCCYRGTESQGRARDRSLDSPGNGSHLSHHRSHLLCHRPTSKEYNGLSNCSGTPTENTFELLKPHSLCYFLCLNLTLSINMMGQAWSILISTAGSNLIFVILTTVHKCNSLNRNTFIYQLFFDVTYPQTYTLSASHMQHTSLYMKR